MKNAAIFVDRDNTIIHDDGYMSSPEQIHLLPGAKKALHEAIKYFRLYMVTNQSGIGRGYYTMEDAQACNRRLLELLELPPPEFHGICIAPETPEQPQIYRKPSPKYILETIVKDNLDPGLCFIIGDKISDLESGINAGISPILVGEGINAPNEDASRFAAERKINVRENLYAAVQLCVEKLTLKRHNNY